MGIFGKCLLVGLASLSRLAHVFLEIAVREMQRGRILEIPLCLLLIRKHEGRGRRPRAGRYAGVAAGASRRNCSQKTQAESEIRAQSQAIEPRATRTSCRGCP